MRTVVVGIDLGTTNSVVAAPGQCPDSGVMFGAITVIWDEFERLIHASAVCEAAGEITIGNEAKDLAKEGYTPARFVKKYMGTTKTFQVGDQEHLPEEISAMVLRHLCQFTEKALQVKVSGAVITHPAYFDGLAISATKRAGELAGLKVAGLLMEPVAAAMAYCAEDTRPQMRVLVYDLGGGTFDVTLIERSGANFVPISFGGNRELGGYNFDKKIAVQMLASLRDKGYAIKIDPETPERDARWATLMHHAEKLKMDVSAKDATKATVRIPSVFKDDAGKSVQLNYTITQAEFLELIKPEIDETMRETKRVLNKANLPASEVDLLVLVGGSCRICAIQQRLRDEFGLDPQFDDDVLDLSVAVGAAMVAAAAGTSEDGVTLSQIPEETNDKILEFSGQVERSEKMPDVTNLLVTVAGGASGTQRTRTNAEGKFYLEADLAEKQLNTLRFTIADDGGTALYDRVFEVLHHAESVAKVRADAKPMLPKAISVETETGFSVLAEEGVTLPYKGQDSFQTIKELTEIPLQLFQEDIPLTTILLTGFSKPVPAGCRVELEVEVGADYTMKATALVPAASIKKSQEVKLKPLVVPSLEELRAQFAQVKEIYSSQLQNTPGGEHKARIGAEGDLLVDEIEGHLKAEFPELLQAFLLIKKLFLFAKQLSTITGLTPPQAEMDAKFEKANNVLAQATAKRPAIKEQALDRTLELLKAEADRANQQNDGTTWSRIARKLDEIIRDLEAAMQDGGGGGVDDVSAIVLQMYVQQEIERIRGVVDDRIRTGALSADVANNCRQQLDLGSSKLETIDLSNERAAKSQIIAVYRQHVLAAERMAGISAPSSGPGGVIRRLTE